MSFYISEEIIESVRNAADIVDVVSESVLLKKTGLNYVGLCPFHSEKTPSFSVNPQKAIFHCFGCGTGGNVFSFVMKRDGASFPEAVRTIAEKYGVEIPETKKNQYEHKVESDRKKLYEVNRLAMEFFKKNLFENKDGLVARDYLKKREMSDEVIRDFNIGYAPDGWDNALRFFLSRKIPRELVEKSGLITTKNGERYYDRFRNRVIFPINDMSQRVIGFGGRVLDQSMPKYLNSPETLIYNKSRSLYGFDRASTALRETKTVHIVEGYFDLLALYMNGIKNVVATLGTALTREHVRMLSRSGVSRFVLVFDSDDAGVQAAKRSVPVFQQEFVNANILVLPEPHDPDSYIRKYGPDNFRKESDNARVIVLFLMESAIKKHGMSIEGRIAVINEMVDVISGVDDSVARSLYIRDLSHRTGVEEKAVFDKVAENMAKINKQPAARIEKRDQKQHSPLKHSNTSHLYMERQIVSMMLQFPEIIEECRTCEVCSLIQESDLKNIAVKVLDYNGPYEDMVAALVGDSFDEKQQNLIAGLAIGDIPYQYKNCLSLIQQYIKSREKTENSLSRRIQLAEEKNDYELLLKLVRAKNAAVKKNKNLSQKKIFNSGTGGGRNI